MNNREAADARHALMAWSGKTPEPVHQGPQETDRPLPAKLHPAPPTTCAAEIHPCPVCDAPTPTTGPASIFPFKHARLPLPNPTGAHCPIDGDLDFAYRHPLARPEGPS